MTALNKTAISDCEFCRIVSRVEKADIVLDTPKIMAFLPLNPATLGHTLVIPKRHVSDLWQLDPRLAGPLLEAVIRVGKGIQKFLTPDGMNLISSAGEAATQSIFHLHLHVVPRWDNDRLGRIWPPDRPLGEELRSDLAEGIREALSKLHEELPQQEMQG
ncbi:HIT family protein [Longispora urticae]